MDCSRPSSFAHEIPGKNTGVGCHALLQCTKVKSESEAAQSCPTLSDPMDCSLPGYPSSLKLMSIKSVMPSSHLIHCRPLLLLPPIPPSIRVFSNESTLRMSQSTGVSALASFLPNKSQGRSPSEWTGWISLQSKGLSRVFEGTGRNLGGNGL